MITAKIGQGCKLIIDQIVWCLSLLKVNPNILTVFGVVVSVFTAVALAMGRFGYAGTLLILAGLFDMLDGAVARVSKSETSYGAFLDSVVDRYSDFIVMLGLIIYYGWAERLTYVVLSGVALMGSVLTSYARARAECLIPSCKVGFLERPERVVILILGALFKSMDAAVWVIAVLSNWTVIHRILYTRKYLKERSAGRF
ncbi:MAG: CDP-alcohol phosphatidyltransferase family protein [Acidobacteria bacterium]|nr:CDP-alcohol phosphatidyltransferase family protein [Acidobacteriota bacterium]